MPYDIPAPDDQQISTSDEGDPRQQFLRQAAARKYGVGAPPPEVAANLPATAPAGTIPANPVQPVIRTAVNPPPVAPQMDQGELQRRTGEVDQYSRPIDKTQPQYKMGIGQRLLRIGADVLGGGVGGALRGAIDPNAPGYYGKGAVNNQYGIDEANRQKNLTAAQTGLKTFDTAYDEQLKGYKENLDAYKQGQLATERQAKADKYENAVDPNSITQDEQTGKWYGQSYGGQQQEVGPPKWYLQQQGRETSGEKETGKLNADLDARTAAADRLKLKGADRTYYIANGKLREPNPDAQARLAQTRTNHADSEADRLQRQADANYNRYQDRLARYNAKKSDIVQREKQAYADLEQKSRDRDGKIKDPDALTNNKATLQRQFADEYTSLGAEPQEPTDRTQGPNQNKAKVQTSQPAAPTSKPSAQKNSQMISVQIPGHPVGQIPANQKQAFLKKYPKAQVIQ